MTMKYLTRPATAFAVVLAAALLLLPALPAGAAVDGIPVAEAITLHAETDYVTSADGGSIAIWGLRDASRTRAQYPAPTLILQQGDTVTITVQNNLTIHPDYPGSDNTSLVFPGHDVTSCSGAAGALTCEATPGGGTASYTFTADQPGTYLYHSGTDPAIQVEMGMLGAIVVRPYGYDALNPTAYGHPDSAYDREYLFVLSEMDSRIHQMVEYGDTFAGSDLLGDFFSNYWFINGRTAPDTMAAPDVPWLPTQPYNILPQMHPGETVLMRVISAGRDLHPYHHHGNHASIIARNGRLLSSGPGAGADLAYEVFTIQAVPGDTFDATFTWTGEKMGWDIYGTPADGMPAHDFIDEVDNETGIAGPDGYDDVTWEWWEDHGIPLPVTLPQTQDLAFGAFWSGSPFMGAAGALPPGEGGLNPNSGYTFMWHSHTEKELTNNDIFPGGMLTMMIVEPPGVEILQ
jgi:hypothetical protein